MKKKIIIPIAVIIILVLLFVPFYVASFDDGGTRVYGALTYKVVAWKKIYSTIDDNGQPVHGTYQNTCVFWYPDSRKNIDELWKIERDNHLLGAELGAPTPTKCPDSALPTLWMNGKLYKVEPIEEGEAEFDEEDFIGTVESEVGYNKTPVKEMESNILPIGASVYKHRELEDTYVGIYHKNGLVYYYIIFENTKNAEESSVHGTSVFNTKNIKRITFYIDYGLGKGNDVSADDIEEIKKWLETFTIDKKVDGTSPPGTNTVYVEIEYLDGTIVKNGIDEIEVDGASYYIKRAMPPDCFQEILTKFVY